MGQEAQCTAVFEGRTSQGRAHLGSEELTFTGDFRLAIPFQEVKAVEAKRGRLSVRFGKEEASFELGPLAEKWALKIRYPRGLMDKLGVKPDSRVAALGVPEESFSAELSERCRDVSSRLRDELDILFFYAGRREDLPRLEKLQGSIKKNGMIWVFWPKGQKQIGRDDVFAVSKAVHLVDVKICSVSAALSGLKLMIPLDRR